MYLDVTFGFVVWTVNIDFIINIFQLKWSSQAMRWVCMFFNQTAPQSR